MKQRTTRRPFARPARSARSAASAPVFQPLEPRKLLTTLYANPDLSLGQTDIFYGYIAMPAWFGGGMQLNASSVEDRAVRVGIRLMDSNPESTASVTILDLAGHPLFPWIGLRRDGSFGTNVEVTTDPGPDGLWGSDDDITVDVFGLDTGYHPGWRVATDADGNFIPGVWIPDGMFHPVRQLEWLEDEEPPTWDFENVPDNFQMVIAPTGYWDPGFDGFYETDDDVRLPIGFPPPGSGTDDRILGTADDAWVAQFASNPWAPPNTQSFEPHLIERVHGIADDGIADFNNGIGQIIFRSTLRTTRLIFFIVEDFEQLVPVTPFAEPDGDRIGIAMNADGSVYQAPGMGSIIIGNPTRWDWTVHDPLNNFIAFQPPGFQRYDRDTEGMRMEDPSLNETMGRVFVDGAIFGLNRFAGALEGIHAGFFGGKLIVDGDLDSVIIAGHSGYFEVNGAASDTRAGITVGRVFGSFVTGGNNSTFVNVQGDFAPDSIVDKPFLRSDKVVLEHERDIHLGAEEDHAASFAVGNMTYILDPDGETVRYLLNDTFGTAQYIGRETSFTVVSGRLGARPTDDQHERDADQPGDYFDYYSVAVERGRTLRVQLSFNTLVTIQDAEGNILASRGPQGNTGDIFFTPNEAGVVYIVIENTANVVNQAYAMTVSDAAAATLGEVRAIGSLTYRFIDGSAITTQVGSIGSIRVGQDRGPDSDGGAPFIGNVLIQSARHIWNITSGGFIGGTVTENNQRIGAGMLITSQGDIAEILAGYGRDIEGGAGEGFHGGSFGAVAIRAQGDIGILRAKASGNLLTELERIYGDIGGIFNDQGSDVFFTDIQANGSIGIISAENRLLESLQPNQGVRIAVGPGQRVDLLEVGAVPVANFDLEAAVGEAGVVDGQAFIETGLGGNIRFFRAPYVWGNGVSDNSFIIGTGQSITLIDDSGAIFTVRVTGTGSVAQIRTHAVQSSVGVATARITANLGANGNLIITNNSGNVEIGDIIVSGAANSRITLNGSGRTDVYLIRAFGGLNRIDNQTSGDIVAIDTDGVNQVRIKGNLGRTFTSTRVGQQLLLGPNYGIVIGPESSGVGDFLAYDSTRVGSGGDPYLAGSPFNPWLNGLAVRAAGGFANLNQVRVEGTIVDVYSEVNINRIIANADNRTPFGDFHGIEGSIYTPGFLTRIDLGDGLVDSGFGPFINGIIAVGETLSRVEIRGEGHNILGTILARGATTGLGINRINANQGAQIIGALISTNHLDSFFLSPDPDSGDAGGSPISDITRIIVNGGSIINSTIAGFNINQVNIKNGIWDSNFLRADSNLNTVRADEFVFRYATEGGQNLITVARNFTRLETQGRRGDINDLTVDVIGDMTNLRANSIVRVSIDVDKTLRTVDARDRIVASLFRAGTVSNFNAQNDITRVTFTVAGPVNQFRSRNSSIIRLDFTVDGPDGRLTTMDARNHITGDIRVSGEIKTLQTRDGDIIGTIHTFSGDGFIRRLQAGRDLILDIDADNDVDQITVGRHFIAREGEALKFRANLRNVDVRGGTFDGTLIVEGAITGTFRLASFDPASEIIARGSINTIDIDGDVDGRILSYTDGIRRLDIDGNFDGSITAANGSLDNVTIAGNVSGTIHADEGIRLLSIRAGAGLGGSGNLTGAVTSDASIDRLDIEGNASGARITALHEHRNLLIRGSLIGSIIGAGERIVRLDVNGDADSSFIIAGLDSLGADNALGGVADNADTFSSGHIDNVNVRGGINNTVFAAGVRSGGDGYATPDATTDLAPGLSNINNVRVDGAASGTNRVIADTTIGAIFVDGTQRTVGDPGANMVLIELDADPLNNGGATFTEAAPVVFTDADGDEITLSIRGPGEGMYLLSGGNSGNLTGLVFNGTAANTNVEIRVTAATGNGRVDLDNVHIQFADDADLGNLTIDGRIDGSDAITIDGSVNTITVQSINTSGAISVGGQARRVVAGSVTTGSFIITYFDTFDVAGAFGGTILSQTIGSLNVRNGAFTGVVWGRDSIGTINNNSTGAVMDRASISTRGEITAINTATIRNVTLISAGDLIRSVNISGDLIESEIHAGLSLGSDGRYGGTGSAADRLTGGVIENVRIQGSFIRGAITAGVARGQDRFYGTADDLGSQGHGVIRSIDVSGSAIGSNFNSQNYGFTASLAVEQVRVGRNDFFQQGNVIRTQVNATPLPLLVERVRTRLEAETFLIDIFFNEEVNISTILLDPNNPQAESAISFENPIDPNGVIPTPNDSYSISYNRDERRATIQFTRAFARDNPGIYTLVIDGQAIRSVTDIGLDANRDGLVGDDYRRNFMIGDAGDRTEAGTWDPDNDPNTNNVDFLAAHRLDLLMDDLVNGTGIKNQRVSFVGQVGDHPDTDPFYFPQKFDMDVFVITLDPGDVFQASLTPFFPGSALVGSITLRNDAGQVVVGEATLAEGFVETTGGTYYLTIGGTSITGTPPPGTADIVDISNNSGMFTMPLPVLPINPNDVANDIGKYEVNVLIFNDGNTGFSIAEETELVDGVPLRFEGFLGFDNNGIVASTLSDVDVFDISRVRLADNTLITQLEEGMTVTVTLMLTDVGGNLGGRYEVGLFQTTETTGIADGLLMGAPSFDRTPGAGGTASNQTFSFRIPEAGTYAVLIQGSLMSNYELIITVDTSTEGDRLPQPYEQNILLELNGGFAHWFGVDGTSLDSFNLDIIGFAGFENEIISLIIEEVTQDFADAGITVHVSIDPADFVGEDFTTVFLTTTLASGGLLGIAQTLDPQNVSKNDEAIVFIQAFAGFFAPGQVPELAQAVADTISHEVGHTLGLRHVASPPLGPFAMMDGAADPYYDYAWLGDPNDPYGTAYRLGDAWFFGLQNEVHLLQLIFDVEQA